MPLDSSDRIRVSLAEAVENSYRNFHAKGLDYICLRRSPELTLKLYFLDGDVSKLPEVVNPHDHRYSFRTTVLVGGLIDYAFEKCAETDPEANAYQVHEWLTPLNGGDGFKWIGETHMRTQETARIPVGGSLNRHYETIHTIKPIADQTCLLLEQFEDRVPLDQPTHTLSLTGEPSPDTHGLYDRFTPDQLISRMGVVSKIAGVEFDLIHDV